MKTYFTLKTPEPVTIQVISYVLVLIIGVMDYVTNPEFSFSLFYLIPIALNGLYLNRKSGIAIAFFSAITWYIVDIYSATYTSVIAPFWNSAIRLGFFLIVVLLLSEIKYLYRNLEKMVLDRTNELTREIAKKNAAETELTRSKNLYQDLVENINEVYYTTDVNGHFRYISPNFFKSTGLAENDIKNKKFIDFVLKEDRDRIKTFYFDKINSNASEAICEFRVLKMRNIIWLEQNSRILRDNDGKAYEIRNLFRDITERKTAELSLIKSELKYQKIFAQEEPEVSEEEYMKQVIHTNPTYIMKGLSERIDEITEKITGRIRQAIGFSSLASHELRTPLAIIRNQLEENLRPDISEQTLRDTTLSVYDEVLRLQRIIGDLLRLSKMEAGTFQLHKEETRLEELLKSFHEDAALLGQAKNIKITLDILKPALTEIDRSYFLQMLFNIIDNALKYTPENGCISITCDSDDQKASVIIKDTGAGIPSEIIQKLYSPFYERNTREGSWGTGLGLIISKWIALLHGGNITLESELGKGTTVKIEVPVHISAR